MSLTAAAMLAVSVEEGEIDQWSHHVFPNTHECGGQLLSTGDIIDQCLHQQ